MIRPLFLSVGARVRCIGEPGDPGPRLGWLGTVAEVSTQGSVFMVAIAWDAVRGNRAQRRRGETPVHFWAFEDHEVAAKHLEVVDQGMRENA